MDITKYHIWIDALKLAFYFLKTLRLIVLLLLMPLLIIQVIWVKLTFLRLEEPKGARSGKCGEGKRVKLLIIGDSAAAGVGVDEQKDALSGQLVHYLASNNKAVDWRLIAKTGFTSVDLIEELTLLTEEPFDYVVISIGVNDVTHLTSASRWTVNIKIIIDLLNTKFGRPNIIITSVPPMQQFSSIPNPLRWLLGQRATYLNNLLANLTKDKEFYTLLTFDFPFVAEYLAKDGFHPSKLSYNIWAKQAVDGITIQH
jgi:lysophospholipase L1-like esterase